MKDIRLALKILIISVVALVALFSAAYFFLVLQGKNILVKQLEDLTHKKVDVSYFGVTAPLNLQIRGLNIEGLAKVDSIYISPSLPGLLIGRIALNDLQIISPEITFEKFPYQETQVAQSPDVVAPAPSSQAATTAAPQRNFPFRLIIRRLIIKNGKLDFIDRTLGQDRLRITVKDINFSLTNLYLFPRSVIANFELKGKIPWQQGRDEGTIDAQGWLNFFKKDMQASLNIQGIDGIYLYPYYSKWVNLEKARIEKANLNFTSNIHGLNNNVTADCHLELTDIVRRPLTEGEEAEKASKIADAVLDILRAMNQGKIVLDFTIHTKMDRPEFGFGNIKMAFEDKLAQGRKGSGFKVQDIIMLPTGIIQGTIKGATDLSKAVVDGTFSIGKEIKKAVEDTLKK